MLPMTTLDSTLGRYLQLVWDRGASDLHLTAGYPPVLRIDGELVPIEGEQRLMPPDVARMIRSMFTEDHWAVYLEKKQLDFSFSYQGLGRFRGNAYQQRGAAALALRGIPYGIKTLDDLKAPAGIHTLLKQPYGLVLCVGPTGSGKSTTLAAMIDEINETARLPHPHDRGSDRIPPSPQEVVGEPARGRGGHTDVRRRPQGGTA